MANVGGMQRVAMELFHSLDGHQAVTVEPLVLRSAWRWTPLLSIPFMAKAIFQIRKKAREGTIDAVIFSSMVTGSLAVALQSVLRPLGVPMTIIAHGQDVTLPFPPYQWLVPRTFAAVDAVLPVSTATAQACLERGIAPEKVTVVPNGVDLTRFDQPRSRETARRALIKGFGNRTGLPRTPDEGLLLCSVGRHVERKGFSWFINHVMPLLPENVHYWVAGSGPETESLEAAVARRQLGDRVRLLGRIPERELRLLYRGADLFIMPNIPVAGDMEGFGVVMLEAGLSGLPVVAARLEGITDVIDDGVNGRLVESGNAWAFAEEILRYHHQPDRLQQAADRAASHTADTFSWEAIARRYIAVLRTLRHPTVPISGDGIAGGDGASEPTLLDGERVWPSGA
ncbi:MAG: glycosyltransferase [Bacteroidetes bacterium]|jgi:phosphatidylinositol alpha-1,6-mannosyltransferase|nr:glycosyltransferase [Bacteroidota bacterium]